MPENGMTIHHKGETYCLDLTEDQADELRKFVNVTEDIPRAPDPLPEWRAKERKQRREMYQNSATLNDIIPNVVDLDKDDLVRLNAFLDVLTAAKSACDGRSWIFETINDLLIQVTMEGPFAANEMDPRRALAGVAKDIETFWFWIDEAKGMLENHERLFPAPPVEPEAVPEPATTSTKPKRQRARKARKAA